MEVETRCKLTQRHFKVFCKEASQWLTVLGITDWEINFRFDAEDYSGDKEEELNEAWISYNMKGRRATIALCMWQANELSDMDIKLAAFHEVIHLLLARLSILAKNDHIDDFDIDEENHAIIARLTHAAYSSKTPLSR